MVEFVLFHLVSIFDDLEALVRKKTESARDKADGIIDIIAVAAEDFLATRR